MQTPQALDTVIRSCYRAAIEGDRVGLERSALPNPGLEAVLANRCPAELRERLVREVAEMQINLRQQTEDRAYLHAYFRGMANPVVVVRTEHGWRMDMRWWIASLRAPDELQMTAREFLYTMLAADQERLAELSVDPRGIEVLTKDHPPAGEMGQVQHVVATMPLAELATGESFPDLLGGSETVTERHRQHGIRVLVGLFDGGEVPFLLRQVEGKWKVVPFHFIRAAVVAAGGQVG